MVKLTAALLVFLIAFTIQGLFYALLARMIVPEFAGMRFLHIWGWFTFVPAIVDFIATVIKAIFKTESSYEF